jgi:dihydrofolate reductase
MARIIVTSFITLDGVIEAPETFSFDFQSDDTDAYNREVLFGADTLLLGRVTYTGFAGAWPEMKDEAGFADRMNSMRKVVVSSTLESADWNNSTIVSGDIARAVQELRDADGQDVLVWGSSTLAQFLIANDLVDGYELLVCPVAKGGGKRLFPEDGIKRKLRRTAVTPLSGGMTAVRLEPAV